MSVLYRTTQMTILSDTSSKVKFMYKFVMVSDFARTIVASTREDLKLKGAHFECFIYIQEESSLNRSLNVFVRFVFFKIRAANTASITIL